jgi:hypothetical protein
LSRSVGADNGNTQRYKAVEHSSAIAKGKR